MSGIINSSKVQTILNFSQIGLTKIPVKLLVTEEVYQSVLSIDITKAVGPDASQINYLRNLVSNYIQ